MWIYLIIYTIGLVITYPCLKKIYKNETSVDETAMGGAAIWMFLPFFYLIEYIIENPKQRKEKIINDRIVEKEYIDKRFAEIYDKI